MEPGTVVRRVWEAMQARRWDEVRSLLAEDLVVDWPQTRERIRGAQSFVELNRTYPGEWSLAVDEVIADGDRVAARVTIINGDEVFFTHGFYTVRDGRIAAAVEVFAEPTDPPYDRSALAERV